MAKKRITIYMQEDDLLWLTKNSIAGSMGGSAVLIMGWTMKQVKRGLVSVLEKFDSEEKCAMIAYAKSLQITADFTPAMLAMGLSDWFSFDEGSLRKWSPDRINKIVETCRDNLSQFEIIALLSWAKGDGNS